MSATENELGTLHVLVAKVLKDRIGDKEVCTAADVNAAIKFLKDNNITCAPGADKHTDELKEELEKQAAANKTAPVDDTDLRAALDAIGHLEGVGAIN